jgi:hypothetical protein
MNAIKGTWKNGQILLDTPADWPEGCRVSIQPVTAKDSFGIQEDDWPTTPEAMAEWLRWYESLEPLEMTPKEEADLAAWRQKTDVSAAGLLLELAQENRPGWRTDGSARVDDYLSEDVIAPTVVDETNHGQQAR